MGVLPKKLVYNHLTGQSYKNLMIMGPEGPQGEARAPLRIAAWGIENCVWALKSIFFKISSHNLVLIT